MTDTTDIGAAARPTWLPWLLVTGIAANLFTVAAVNFWIYYARAAFIAGHPEVVARKPPTISRAIADPAIGEPFAVWVTLSALTLAFGVGVMTLAYLRIAANSRPGRPRLERWVALSALSLLISQIAASVGMYMISNFRFPHDAEMHMTGSYLFFAAQTLVVLLSGLLCLSLARSPAAASRARRRWGLGRGWFLIRGWIAFASVGLSLVYAALFYAKAFDWGGAGPMVYQAYVLAEPVAISSFLLVLALHQPDLWAAARERPET